MFLAIIVEGELVRPPIVSLPGIVGALENKIGGSIIPDDENNVALQIFAQGGEFANINAAKPIVRDRECGGGLPLAFAQTIFTNRGLGLGAAAEGAVPGHESSPCPTVIAHAVDIEGELSGGIGADENIQLSPARMLVCEQ